MIKVCRCAYISILCLCICVIFSMMSFHLLVEAGSVEVNDDIPMTTNPGYMETTLSAPQPPP